LASLLIKNRKKSVVLLASMLVVDFRDWPAV
jgi:hypothetical protein